MIEGMVAENTRVYLRFFYVLFTFYIDFGLFKDTFKDNSMGWCIPMWIAAGTIWLIARIEANPFGGGRLVIILPWGLFFYIHLILFSALG